MRLFSYLDDADDRRSASSSRAASCPGWRSTRERLWIEAPPFVELDPSVVTAFAGDARLALEQVARAVEEARGRACDRAARVAPPGAGRLVAGQDRLRRAQLPRPRRREGGRAARPARLLFAKFANAVIGRRRADRPAGRARTRSTSRSSSASSSGGGARARRRDGAPSTTSPATSSSTTSAPATGRATRRRCATGEHGDGQWLRAKGSDTFLPIGPVFVTPDELPDPHAPRAPLAGGSPAPARRPARRSRCRTARRPT